MFCQTWIMRAVLTVLFFAFAAGLRLFHSHPEETVEEPMRIEPVAAQPSQTAASTSAPTLSENPTNPALPSIGSVEVCGVGTLPSDGPALKDFESMMNAKLATEQHQWLDGMLHSGDLRTRATGLLYATREQTDWPRQAATEATLAPLVHLALDARDPVVYAMAVYACRPQFGATPSGSCDKITLEDWAALDADNAIPWITIGNSARATKDAAAKNAAFAKAANATRYEVYSWSLFTHAEPLIPSTVNPLERRELIGGFIGFESSFQQPSASQHCSATAVADSTIRTQCNLLAEIMVTKGTTLIDFGVGISIGERVGWPPDRVARLRERRNAYMQLMMTRPGNLFGNPQDQLKCEAVVQANEHAKEWALLGEIGSFEQELQRSGKTTAELAREYQDSSEDMIRKAQPRESEYSTK